MEVRQRTAMTLAANEGIMLRRARVYMGIQGFLTAYF
jgi:hypothetical protein